MAYSTHETAGQDVLKIKVLGASGSEVGRHLCPAFAVDGKLLLDAGTVGVSLNINEEREIRTILLSHAHFDHIKGIPFLLDNLVSRNTGRSVTVMGAREVIEDLRANILNDRIWPDFSRIPTPDAPVVRYAAIRPDVREKVDGYGIAAEKVSHTVCAYGYILEDAEGKVLAYTGDTGPTDLYWKKMNQYRVDCLIVETSFPNRMEDESLRSGHLTPSLLRRELGKMRTPPARIFLIHAKPQYQPEIEKEIREIGRDGIRFLTAGEVLEI
jgi:ribonuclease BN (tRNA processing enzyme)